jgi:hypothetical protein
MATYTIHINERTKEGRGLVNYLREKGLIPPIKTAGKPTTHKQGISLDLQARLDKAREEYRKGNYVSCSTKEELTAFLEAL